MTTMLTIDWAIRETCMASRTRPSDGTARRARYEGAGVTGCATDRLRRGGFSMTGSVPQNGRVRRTGALDQLFGADQASRPQSGSTTIGALELAAACARAAWLCAVGAAVFEAAAVDAVPWFGVGVLTPIRASACSALACVSVVNSGSRESPENRPSLAAVPP